MPKRRIQQVVIEDDGLQISFYTPETDAKAPGIVQLHTLMIPRGADYDEEILAVEDAVEYLINDVLDDWSDLQPFQEEG